MAEYTDTQQHTDLYAPLTSDNPQGIGIIRLDKGFLHEVGFDGWHVGTAC
jgi:hypothetical protein